MGSCRFLAFVAITVAQMVPCGSAHAQGAEIPVPAGWAKCTLGGWTNNAIAEDIVVRAGPAVTARSLGRLPTIGADYEYSVTFRIIGARNGWLRISGASDDYNLNEGKPARPVYRGTGWIPADSARFAVQSQYGYDRPDATGSPVIGLDDWPRIERILSCDGEWALLDVDVGPREQMEPAMPIEQGKTGRGWFRGVCAIEETTCDMPSVDDRRR